jgi:hypothetical protein
MYWTLPAIKLYKSLSYNSGFKKAKRKKILI